MLPNVLEVQGTRFQLESLPASRAPEKVLDKTEMFRHY
jgi:hypothetical protein